MPAQKNNSNSIQEKLLALRLKEEEARARMLAQKLNLPYLNLVTTPVEKESLAMLNEEKSRAAKMAVIKRTDRKLHIALANPADAQTESALQELSKQGFQYSLFIVSNHSLKKVWAYYLEIAPPAKKISGQVEISADFLKNLQKEIKNFADIKQKIQAMPQAEASRVLEIIIAGSLQTESSDIHIEAKEKETLLRYRIDGLLHDITFLSPKTYQLLLSRLKLLAALKLNIHNMAQDGRFTVRLDKTDIENRVSVIPSAYGENIVIRVLNPKTIRPGLKDLGLRPDLYQIIEKKIQRPNGMIITTGPTGSGKTTTLYAFLKARTTSEIKIITLEDPIEYHLTGVIQTQVETEEGYTFANGLRAILRQDPDIILVGEIRDQETAEVAVHSALTGHLLFSTLHTNDAAGAIPRLIELKVKPATLSSALNLIIAQRLVRKICVVCQKEIPLNALNFEKIKKALQGLPKNIQPKIDLTKIKFYRGQGCAKCNQTGYKGRVGIFEIIPIDHDLEKLISHSPSHAEIIEMAPKKGLTTMFQDGILKILEGLTTLEEVEAVVGAKE